MKSLYLGLIIAFVYTSCNSSQSTPLNPNGDSELAVLMREMYEDGLKMKKQVKVGGVPTPTIDHSKMLTAEPTEPNKIATPEYATFTESYLQILQSMKNADRNSANGIYTSMVDLCKSCHQSLCPGPIVKIDKLYLDAPLTE